MKKLFKASHSIAAILTLCILLGVVGPCVYAASVMTEVSNVIDNTNEELVPVMASGCNDYGDDNGDVYGYAGWPSLEAAMLRYGLDFTYSVLLIPIIKNGNIYTHYYTFTNGSRMYFGVSG